MGRVQLFPTPPGVQPEDYRTGLAEPLERKVETWHKPSQELVNLRLVAKKDSFPGISAPSSSKQESGTPEKAAPSLSSMLIVQGPGARCQPIGAGPGSLDRVKWEQDSGDARWPCK